jgi:hypothetical protein
MKFSLVALAVCCAVAGSVSALQNSPHSTLSQRVLADIPGTAPPHLVLADIPGTAPPHLVLADIPGTAPPHLSMGRHVDFRATATRLA